MLEIVNQENQAIDRIIAVETAVINQAFIKRAVASYNEPTCKNLANFIIRYVGACWLDLTRKN